MSKKSLVDAMMEQAIVRETNKGMGHLPWKATAPLLTQSDEEGKCPTIEVFGFTPDSTMRDLANVLESYLPR